MEHGNRHIDVRGGTIVVFHLAHTQFRLRDENGRSSCDLPLGFVWIT